MGSVSLFPEMTNNYSVEIVLDNTPSAADIRDLSSLCKDEDCLMILRSKHRANFNRDKYIDCIDLGDDTHTFSVIKDRTGLDDRLIHQCIDSSSNPLSALSQAYQMLWIDGDRRFTRFIIDPMKKDNLPWDLIDYIVSGDSQKASQEAASLLISGEEPVALCFQIMGYMQKLIMSLSPKAADTKWFKSQKIVNMFSYKARRVISATGLLADISDYPSRIMSVSKRFQKVVFVAMVASLSTRFKKG